MKRSYLYGETAEVRCPNWQCSGNLFLKFEEHFDGTMENGWQMPSLECDDCHTVWRNSMLGEKKK